MPDRLLACLGACLGIALTIVLCARAPQLSAGLPIIVAPLGASAVLVFAVPASPLAQPWPVIGGNVISALVGVAMARIVPNEALAAGLAVGGAILAMSLLRCLHPPGGAAALTVVIGGPAVHAAGYGFALLPVGINSLALVACGLAFHRLSRQSYPHRPAPVAVSVAAPVSGPVSGAVSVVVPGLHLADIDAALAEMHESFDIAREDLDALLSRAEAHAAARRASPGTSRTD